MCEEVIMNMYLIEVYDEEIRKQTKKVAVTKGGATAWLRQKGFQKSKGIEQDRWFTMTKTATISKIGVIT